jgi:hypothetical protein
MKEFIEYLAESTRSYAFTIKFAKQPTEEQVSILEAWLDKYDLKEWSRPTLIKENHKDFIDQPNREVYAMDVVLGLPVSQYILLQDLTRAANISEKFMVVRSHNEPIEQYSRYDVWKRQQDALEKKQGMEQGPRLSTDRLYSPAEQPIVDPLFGNQYNEKLLSYLANVSETRPTDHIDSAQPLFSWLQLEDVTPGEPIQDTSDFNAHIKTPKPTSKGEKTEPVQTKFVNNNGEMSDNSIPRVRFYKDPITGKAKQVIKPMEKN